ncbi:MAG TPA: glycosyltransferase family 4 protein [Candidatus Omnitrophota bacterium]|nr:glycosyltransferase family 4 protein [Candidatus Omnitrophota bacterium]
MSNVLFINPTSRIGGAEKSLLQIVAGLARNKYWPIVLLPDKGPLADDLAKLGVKVIYAPRFVIEAHSLLELPIALFWLGRIVKGHNISVIHCNSKFASRLPALFAGQTKTKVILHWRDFSLWPDEKHYINKYQSRLVFFAISEGIRTFLMENGIDGSRIELIYDGADGSFYEVPPQKDNKRLTVAVTGRIDNWKGHEYLIEAMQRIKDLPVDLEVFGEFHEINDRDYLNKLKGLVYVLGLSDRVRFTGFQKAPASALAQVDIVCVPSIFEPFGMVAVEAMAAGRPVIASNTGGLRDIIEDGATGYLVEPKNPEAIADKLRLLCSDPELRKKLGTAARERARTKFSVKDQLDTIERIYDEIIGDHTDQ